MSSPPPAPALPVIQPTAVPPVPPYPPATYGPGPQMPPGLDHARLRGASNFLVGAVVLHALAIPIGLVLFKALVESIARRSVSWAEIFQTLDQTGYLGLFLAGIFGQMAFALVAAVGAVLVRSGRTQAAIPLIIVGIIGVIFSFAVFGGIVGAIGGGLMAAGGAKARSRPRAPWAYPPPAYGPPPYRP